MSRTRVLSLALAGLTTGVLLLWANLGSTSPLLNATWLVLGITGSLAAIWLAWSPHSQSTIEPKSVNQHTYPEL